MVRRDEARYWFRDAEPGRANRTVELFTRFGALTPEGNLLLHREDGPAIEYANGNKTWYQDGKTSRSDGPAMDNATEFPGYAHVAWYMENKLHRDDGPAVTYADGYRQWYRNGALVRSVRKGEGR